MLALSFSPCWRAPQADHCATELLDLVGKILHVRLPQLSLLKARWRRSPPAAMLRLCAWSMHRAACALPASLSVSISRRPRAGVEHALEESRGERHVAAASVRALAGASLFFCHDAQRYSNRSSQLCAEKLVGAAALQMHLAGEANKGQRTHGGALPNVPMPPPPPRCAFCRVS